MNLSDITFILQWWFMLFVIGLIFLPLTNIIFSKFFDRGYIFARILGIAFISYVVFVLGVLKILPFSTETIILITAIALAINIFIFLKVTPSKRSNLIKSSWKLFFFEELLFILTLFFWSYIRAHQPDIHGLEKYMDFGFINSILRSDYFPPPDMWLTPFPINYYYFGHLVTVILTKLSVIPSPVTFNLMLATISAFTFTASFSIGGNLLYNLKAQSSKLKNTPLRQGFEGQATQNSKLLFGGLLTAFLVSLGGNLHTIYTFFKPYVNENPVPFWQLAFSPNSFPNSYWYPNATRFIHNTIHEFPIYSSVVSDLHGHFLDVPFTLLTIAVLFSLMLNFANKNASTQNSKLKTQNYNSKLKIFNLNSFTICDLRFTILLAFMLAVMYMTNAWDGIIYFLFAAFILLFLCMKLDQPPPIEIKNEKLKMRNYISKLKIFISYIALVSIGSILFSLPFSINFRPFASGIGVLCTPEFLTNIGKLGPFLFEKDHCQHSPLWQFLTLYGFFYFWVVSFIVMIFKIKNQRSKIKNANQKLKSFKNLNFIENFKLKIENLTTSDLFTLLLIVFSTLLIIIPEFIYVKDIYPGHYRANTMFKLVYQSFIMLSIASAYIIVRIMPIILHRLKNTLPNIFNFSFVFFIFSILFFILVMIYPYLAINSYYGDLKTYYSLDGTLYLKTLYPTDYQSILWINKNIKGQSIILEAQGDSYTDYGRVSTNTGLPTVLGWAVHEWLWRGSYDIPSPRIEEVQKMYESEDLEDTKNLLKKYKVELVFFGDLERQKYPNLIEDKFKTLGKVIYKNGNTRIYKVD